jgi:hypothetical protein
VQSWQREYLSADAEIQMLSAFFFVFGVEKGGGRSMLTSGGGSMPFALTIPGSKGKLPDSLIGPFLFAS